MQKPKMHAGAQDGIGLTAFRRTLEEIGEIGLHDLDVQNSGYMRPRLNTPAGSKACFRLR